MPSGFPGSGKAKGRAKSRGKSSAAGKKPAVKRMNPRRRIKKK